MFAAIWQGLLKDSRWTPKSTKGLRRKNQPGLVCSSTDYKGLGGFFYLPLWYGPNHGCQFSPALLGSHSAFIFFFFFLHTSPLCQTSAFLCFVFHFHLGFALHVYISIWHLLFSVPILVTDRKHRTLLFSIKRMLYFYRLIILSTVALISLETCSH